MKGFLSTLFVLSFLFSRVISEEIIRPVEAFTVLLKERNLVFLSSDQEVRNTVPRSTYKLRVDHSDYSFLLSFGFNIHGDHAIFIRNDDGQKRALNFIIDRYFIQMSAASLFSIVFDSSQKKTFGITGHLGEIVVNGRTLPHGQIVLLEFSGFKDLFVNPKNERNLSVNIPGEPKEREVQTLITIPPDLSIASSESTNTLELNVDRSEKNSLPLSEIKEIVVEEKPRAPFEISWIQGFDFEQIQYRVLSRLQEGLERAVKVARNPQGVPADAFEKVMGEKIWRPLEGDQKYQSEGAFQFAKESLENENRLIYHRVAQLRKLVIDLIQSHSNPSPSLIPMIPKAELISCKKAASAFNSARYQEARSIYKALYEKDLSSLYLLSNLGSVEYLCGNFEASINHLEKAIELAPYDGYSYGTLAIVKSQGGRAEEAIDDAIISIALSPEIAESYLGLGIILYDRGWYVESKKSLEDGLTKNPNSGDLHRALAKTLMAIGEGRGDKCQFHYKRSVQLGVKKDKTFE